MKHLYFSPERDGFYGAYYPLRTPSHKAMILMLGDAVDDALALAGVRWLHEQQIAVLAMAPAKKITVTTICRLSASALRSAGSKFAATSRLASSAFRQPACLHSSPLPTIQRFR